MTLQTSNSLQNISNKRLSVQIALTGLSFLVRNNDRTEVLLFSEKSFDTTRTPEELLLELDTLFAEHLSFDTNFESVSVVYANSEYTIVPASLFDETKASDYLKFNSKILSNDFIAWDSLDARDMKVVYVPYVNINNYLFEKFGSFDYFHSTTLLLKTLKSPTFDKQTLVQVLVRDGVFDLIVQKGGKLVLCNSYPFKTPEDFIYYILFAFEQLKLNPDEVKVEFMGAISENDDHFAIAHTYIRNLSFYEPSVNVIQLGESLPHQHFLLKNCP